MNLGPWHYLRWALPWELVPSRAGVHILEGKQHLLCLIKSFVSINRLWQKDQRSRSLGSALEPWLCH